MAGYNGITTRIDRNHTSIYMDIPIFTMPFYICVRFQDFLLAPSNYIYFAKAKVSSYSVYSHISSMYFLTQTHNSEKGQF